MFFSTTWKAKCPIFKAIVAGFTGKVAVKDRTLGVPGSNEMWKEMCDCKMNRKNPHSNILTTWTHMAVVKKIYIRLCDVIYVCFPLI